MDRDASADSSTCFRQMTDMSDTMLVRVVAPHFVAGLIMQGDK